MNQQSANTSDYFGDWHSTEAFGWISVVKRWSYIVMLVSALGGCISGMRTKPNSGDYEPHILKRGTYLAQHNGLLGLSLTRHQ